MQETTEKFFKLLFNEGETVCITSGNYGAHSIHQYEIQPEIVLRTPEREFTIRDTDIQLVGVNPINGWKRDENVTAHRNFMLELDEGDIQQQIKYVRSSNIPYSACVFSGNKSVHFVIAVEHDYGPTIWKYVNQWILNVLKLADQQNKSPSRGVRVPGNRRKNGAQQMQTLLDCRGRITQEDLNNWLSNHMDKKPIIDRPSIPDYGNIMTVADLPPSIVTKLKKLQEGLQDNRNATWFGIASYMAHNGVSIESAETICDMYFVEEKDFKRNELLTCIKSAYKDRKYGR